jgi:hypothetical protein
MSNFSLASNLPHAPFRANVNPIEKGAYGNHIAVAVFA